MLFDTHAHLTDERFRADLPSVLDRAATAGVVATVCIATTADDSPSCIAIASQYPKLWASVGIQPNHVAEAKSTDWDAVVALAESNLVVGIGETGLDRHWDFTPFDLQEDYFARHIDLARSRDLPLVIHCREAEADVVRMLRDEFERRGPIRGVMHSFTGDAATAAACLQMGLFISFAGMVTYKSAGDLRAVAMSVPLERLLVETDCPYLAPVPVRGQRNEPAYVVHTATCLARERVTPIDRFLQQTTENAFQLFHRIPNTS